MPRLQTTIRASLVLVSIALGVTAEEASARERPAPLFAPAATGPLKVGGSPVGLATIDMKGDGYDELVVASADRNRIEVLNNRLGRIRVTSRNLVDPSPSAIASDGGESDRVLVASAGSDTARVFYNDYFAVWVNHLSLSGRAPVGREPVAAAAGGDGVLWVTANRGSDDLTELVVEGYPRERVEAPATIPVGDAPVAVAVDPSSEDIVSADSGSGTLTYLPGGGTVGPETIPVGGEPAAVAFADLVDGDYREKEILVADRAGNRVELVDRPPAVPFQPRQPWRVVAAYPVGDGPTALAVGGFDERLGPDVAVVDSRSGDVALLANDGWGHLRPDGRFRVGRHPVAVAPIAYGRHFHPDLAVADRGSGDLTFLLRRERGSCRGHVAKLFLGTSRDDGLGSDEVANETHGLAGKDRIGGGGGADCLFGEGGDDSLVGGEEDDRLYPGPGEDYVEGQSGDDTIFARDGERDTILCGSHRFRSEKDLDTVYADPVDSLRGCERQIVR